MSNLIQSFIQEEEGQSTVEYMLLISVIVIAIVAAGYAFVPKMQKGVEELGKDVSKILGEGKIGSSAGLQSGR